jgi:hypothetical protein
MAFIVFVLDHDNTRHRVCGDRERPALWANWNLDRYVDSVYRVDLSEVPESEIASAMNSCGPDFDGWKVPPTAEDREWINVECLVDYGCASPMAECSDPSYPERARAAARREVEQMIADSDHTEALLDRPVNRIGSTARDFGRGDSLAGLDRYKRAKEASSLSVPMGKVPSDDPLAYVHGYQTGATGGGLPADREDLAPAWLEGHALGRRVLAGEVEAPGWAKPVQSTALDLMAKMSG